jgi:hypothetical protein
MAAFRARTEADLITIALIIGFGITGLASLSQSMDPAIPLALALRLRGNANNCHRSAEQNRRTLKSNHPAPKSPPAPPPAQPEPVPASLIARAEETRKRTAEHLAQFAAPQRAATPHQPTKTAATMPCGPPASPMSPPRPPPNSPTCPPRTAATPKCGSVSSTAARTSP